MERIPTRNMKNMRRETRGKHEGEYERESLHQQGIDHTSARSPNTKRYTRSKVNKGRGYKETVLLHTEVLMIFPRKGS